LTSPTIYQQAVREIYEAIAGVDTVTTNNVQYNAVIEGKTSTHEVEVYWEFTDGDVTYKLIVQSKEQASSPELFTFMRTLRDIPGLVLGVVVTQPIYQKDIKVMANKAGILLYEMVQPAATETWEAVIGNIQINVDKAWVKEAKEQAGLGDEPIQMNAEPKYSFIYNEAKNCIDTVQGIFDYYSKQKIDGNTGKQTMIHSFAAPAFLQTTHDLVPFIKLDNIPFDIEMLKVDNLVGREMLDNILDITLKYFGNATKKKS
jgi:hypothetical protein